MTAEQGSFSTLRIATSRLPTARRLMIKTGGQMALRQGRHEGVPQVGDGVLLVYRQPSQIRFQDATYLSVRVPFHAMAMLADLDAAAAHCIAGNSAALALLRHYVASLPDRLADPVLGKLVATHVYDLMALAIGASGEGREIARGRGVRAARLEAIKADLTRDAALTIDEIARRQCVTPRYCKCSSKSRAPLLANSSPIAGSTLRGPCCSALGTPRGRSRALLSKLASVISRTSIGFRRRFGSPPSDLRRQGWASAGRGDR